MNKSLITILISGLAVAPALLGQTGTPPAKIDVKKIEIQDQRTPQFNVQYVTDKRWKPKQWIELDAEFDIKLPRDAGGSSGSLPSMDVKFYVGLNQADKSSNKPIVLTGSITYNNVPADETSHALAFVSPSTLKRVFMKDDAGKGDVRAFGVEVSVGGEILAVSSSTGSPWWYDPSTKAPSDKFMYEDGGVLPKNKTPFAPLWGDYDLPAVSK